MTGNRSLDEFAGGEEADDVEADDPAKVEALDEPERAPGVTEADETDGGDAGATGDGAAVEPMAETFAWSADGGECASCGGTVEARWRDGDDLVCADCKAW